MRIHSLFWRPYTLPFHRPFQTAMGRMTERQGFLLWILDERGRMGVGEAAPLESFGTESPEIVRQRFRAWSDTLPGQEVPLPPPNVKLIGGGSSIPPCLGLVDEVSAAPASCHALELALLDLAAQNAGVPLCNYLGESPAAAVRVNATLGAGEPSETAAQARQAVNQGFDTLKVKVGVGGPDSDEARLRAVRKAVGERVHIRADANGAWSEEEALRILERWRDIGLEYLEQPLPATVPAAMARLASASPVPIAADESAAGLDAATRSIVEKTAQVLVLKPMVLGGILTTLRIAEMALGEGMAVVVTTSLEGIYGRMGALHAAAVLHGHQPPGNFAAHPACGLATGGLLAQDFLAGFPIPEKGRIAIPSHPGLGVRRIEPDADHPCLG